HGGLFKKLKTRFQYVGGEGRTFLVDVDELCWSFLEQMARKCGAYKKIVKIYYLMPHSTLDEGVKRVYNEKEVLEMAEVVLRHKALDLYVVHGVDVPKIFYQDLHTDYHKFYDDRPESPIPLKDLLGDSGSDTSYPAYEPESEGSDEELNDEDFEQENEDFEVKELGEEEIPFELNEADSSDDELREARNKVKKRNAEWYEIAQTIREQAI
ncbi:Glycine dehydrogenase, partial [Bienertia sinuspersici]